MKIVINNVYGGFSLSDEAMRRLGLEPQKHSLGGDWNHLGNADLGIESDNFYAVRADPRLVQVVEELGSKAASGRYAGLAVVEIPDGVDWEIEEYDGNEWVSEQHRTWAA